MVETKIKQALPAPSPPGSPETEKPMTRAEWPKSDDPSRCERVSRRPPTLPTAPPRRTAPFVRSRSASRSAVGPPAIVGAVSELAEGTLITPTIRLKRQLGKGGMGTVWLADHLRLKAQVVVKFLADDLVGDPTSRARFSREAAAAAQVRSPHVVQTLDHGISEEGKPFIVLELLEGRDLALELRSRTLSIVEVAHVVEHVCRALSRAHDRGIVHRDIKPSNIFLCDVGTPEPFVKLLDFGVAKHVSELSSLTAEGAAVGTLSYMSPEQITGAEVGARADLWALGIVAYRALTGRSPFPRATQSEVVAAILGAPPPAISQLRSDVPPSIDQWFAKACAKDPAARFESARAMANGFWEAAGLQSSPYAATPPTPIPAHVVAAEATKTESMATAGTLRSSVSDSGGDARRGARRVGWLVAAGAGALALVGTVVGIQQAMSPPAGSAAAPVSAAPATPAASTVVAEPTPPASASAGPDAGTPMASASAPPAATRDKPPAPRRPTPRRPVSDDDVSDLGF